MSGLYDLFNNNLRIKILVPIAALLVISFVVLLFVISSFQGRMLSNMGTEVNFLFTKSNNNIQENLKKMDADTESSLKKMSATVKKILVTETTLALDKEKKNSSLELEKSLKLNSESLAELLASVAGSAIMSNNFSNLISYIKAACNNPDVVYAFYLNTKDRPYVRYINRNRDEIKNYLKTGTGKRRYEKILSASLNDKTVFRVEKKLQLEGKELGSMILCVSRKSINEKIDKMSARFSSMIDANSKKIGSTLGLESSNVLARIGQSLSKVNKETFTSVSDAEKKIKSKNERIKTRTEMIVIVAGLICAVIMLLITGFMVISFLIKPVEMVAEKLKDIAQGEGDLKTRLEIRNNDEIGKLAGWFNVFIEKIQVIITDITDNSKVMNQSSKNFLEVSEGLARAAEQTSEKSDTLATAAEQMSANMNSVAEQSKEGASNIHTIAAAVEQMTASIDDIARNTANSSSTTKKAVQYASKVSKEVNLLGSAADEISKVTEAIKEISEQTNLLALNATIEAARAGEAGKGFAVVASEIKALALQTADATSDIKKKIDGIQSSATTTVAEIENISNIIHEIDEMVVTIASAVEEQTATTKEIAGNVAQTSQGIGNISDNVDQSSIVAEKTAKDIIQVNGTAGEISSISAQVKSDAEVMADLAEKLQAQVDKFKV